MTCKASIILNETPFRFTASPIRSVVQVLSGSFSGGQYVLFFTNFSFSYVSLNLSSDSCDIKILSNQLLHTLHSQLCQIRFAPVLHNTMCRCQPAYWLLLSKSAETIVVWRVKVSSVRNYLLSPPPVSLPPLISWLPGQRKLTHEQVQYLTQAFLFRHFVVGFTNLTRPQGTTMSEKR